MIHKIKSGIASSIVSRDLCVLFQNDIFKNIFLTESNKNILENHSLSNSNLKYFLIEILDIFFKEESNEKDLGLQVINSDHGNLVCYTKLNKVNNYDVLLTIDIKNNHFSEIKKDIMNNRKILNLFNNIPLGILSIDNELNIFEANNYARSIFCFKKNSNLSNFIDDIGLTKIKHSITNQEKHVSSRKIEVAFGIEGIGYILEITVLDIKEEKKFILLIQDITEKAKYNSYLIERISKDSLTGLSSRNFLIDSLEECSNDIKFGRIDGFALFIIDIDRFKNVNDSFTHAAGNQVLKLFSERLIKAFNDLSIVISRLGGDEFSILKTQISNKESIEFLCNKIRNTLIEPILVEDSSISLTCSIGVSVGNKEINNSEEVLRNAEIAMYDAKKSGRGRFKIYQSGMHEKVLKNLKLETCLRDAVINDSLKLFLQPIVHTSNYNLTHFEALCRWEHSLMGFISPMQFIPLAEETGQIHSIGDWMILKVCKQIKSWESSGKKIYPISINLSPLQFERSDLPETFKRYLEKFSISSKYINVELTESIIMSNIDYSKRVLKQLKEMGIKIFLDDFGTGFSSLNYLVHFPIDFIKIDKSFIDNITRYNNGLSVVNAIQKMAESLNIKVVAEGVENLEQYNILKNIGIEFVQGYFTGKPLDPLDVDNFKFDIQMKV